MECILWDQERYSIGHPLLDEQRQQIATFINKLISLSYTGYTEQMVKALFVEIVEYSENQFAIEEEILSSLDAPSLERHIKSHDLFRKESANLIAKCDGRDLGHALGFLINWWSTHILIEDMQYKSLLAAA